MYTNLF